MDSFLRWSHPNLLEPRLLHCCWLWQVLHALDLEPARHAAPDRGPVSELVLPDSAHPLAISSAFGDPQGRITFRIAERRSAAYLLGLYQSAAGVSNPLNREQWQFWLVPSPQLHPDRQSLGLQVLIRAQGEGRSLQHLPEMVAQLCGAPFK